MTEKRSPQAIAAELHDVLDAYREKREQGHHRAFLAAVAAYRKRHPEVAKPAATHVVTQMMRAMESETPA